MQAAGAGPRGIEPRDSDARSGPAPFPFRVPFMAEWSPWGRTRKQLPVHGWGRGWGCCKVSRALQAASAALAGAASPASSGWDSRTACDYPARAVLLCSDSWSTGTLPVVTCLACTAVQHPPAGRPGCAEQAASAAPGPQSLFAEWHTFAVAYGPPARRRGRLAGHSPVPRPCVIWCCVQQPDVQ